MRCSTPWSRSAASSGRARDGAERGIERLIIESEIRAEASGMMVAVIALMLVGVALSAMIRRLRAYLLRWQQHNMVE
jgi:NitT/TauT family transport system permease protein